MEATQAQHFLRNVDEGVKFTFANGKTAVNLGELLMGIRSLNDEEYHRHVYPDHNDFTNWLLDILSDEILARDVFSADQAQSAALVKARIHFLEEHAK